jgi:hypothetical protein
VKRVQIRMNSGAVIDLQLSARQAEQLPRLIGQAWNQRTGVMYTFVDGGGTHLINLLFVEGVDIS